MINIYKILNDSLVQFKNIADVNIKDDIFWVDLISPTDEEFKLVKDFFKIYLPTRQEMEGVGLSSRFYEDEDAKYMTMSAISQAQLDAPVKTPMTFISHRHGLLSLRYHELISITQYVERATKKGIVMAKGPEPLMLDLLEALIDRISDSLVILGADIDCISADIFRTQKITVRCKSGSLQAAIIKVGAMGDLLNMLGESLTSMGRLMSHIDLDRDKPELRVVQSKMNVLNKDVEFLSDHATFLSGKINFLLDATLGMINLEQNQIIKIFSIAAVVFLPPTMVATIYGMNFKHMPELDWMFGYPLAVLMMVISALLPLLYFKKKGWL